MDNIKPAARLGIIGAIIAGVVIWVSGLVTGTELIGEGAPMFGPLPAGGIFILALGIVGAIIGATRKK